MIARPLNLTDLGGLVPPLCEDEERASVGRSCESLFRHAVQKTVAMAGSLEQPLAWCAVIAVIRDDSIHDPVGPLRLVSR